MLCIIKWFEKWTLFFFKMCYFFLRDITLFFIFLFERAENCILNLNSHFWGVCFIKKFYVRPPYICFWYFGTLGGLFWVWFLVFENFEIVLWIRIPTFGGVCFLELFEIGGLFYKTFWFEASLYMFRFFGTLGGLFWVSFLVFENFEIVFWIRITTFGGSLL